MWTYEIYPENHSYTTLIGFKPQFGYWVANNEPACNIENNKPSVLYKWYICIKCMVKGCGYINNITSRDTRFISNRFRGSINPCEQRKFAIIVETSFAQGYGYKRVSIALATITSVLSGRSIVDNFITVSDPLARHGSTSIIGAGKMKTNQTLIWDK